MFRHARTHATILGAAAALGTLGAAPPALAAGSTASPGGVSPTGTSTAPTGSSTSSGGAALTPTTTGITPTSPSSSTGSSTSTNPPVEPGNVTVSASGAGITVSTIKSALLRNQLTFSGTAPASDAGRTIEIDRLGHETQWTWQPTVTATIGPQGTFSATWATDHIGEFEMRAILSGSRARAAAAGSASSGGSAPTLLVTVYRPSVASWYGDASMWGTQTACGVKLTRQTIGLANKTLACGTDVALYYQGKTLIVPVIDHGPYVNGRDWDLTEATAQALGIGSQGVVTLGAVSLPKPPATVAIAG